MQGVLLLSYFLAIVYSHQFSKYLLMKSCLYCESDHLHKNGILPSGGQRWKCADCTKQFST